MLAFFEERRGRLYGFRFRDRVDGRSGPPGRAIGPLDQPIGTGDGATATFPLVKTYGSGFAPYRRRIAKPVAGSVRIAISGQEIGPGPSRADPTTGLVTVTPEHVPSPGAAVTAGFAFDVPVRFDTDELTIDLAPHGREIPRVPLVEIVP